MCVKGEHSGDVGPLGPVLTDSQLQVGLERALTLCPFTTPNKTCAVPTCAPADTEREPRKARDAFQSCSFKGCLLFTCRHPLRIKVCQFGVGGNGELLVADKSSKGVVGVK